MTYPTITPKLTLDFANSRQLDPRITFSRSSTATYLHPDTGLITTAPSGVARFEKEGLLVEEARTNLVTTSTPTGSGLGNGWAQRANTTITTNADVAPDGTTTATSVVANLNSNDYAYTRFTLGSSTTAISVVSAFAKPLGSYTNCVLQSSNTVSGTIIWRFNFGTGLPELINDSAGTTTAFMEPLANGWFRVGYTAPIGTSNITVNGRESWGGGQPLGDGVSGALFWGCQIEQGGFQTSFIPTAGSTITRAADLANIAGTNFSSWYNTSEGTIILRTPKTLPSAGNRYYYAIGPSGSERIATWQPNNFSFRVSIQSSGATFSASIANPDEPIKSALSFNGSGASWAVNGSIVNTSTTITPPATAAQLSFSTRSTGAVVQDPITKFHLTGFVYYDRRVSDAELQSLTS